MTDLAGARALITGGAGLVGSTIADQLLLEHDVAEVVVLDDLVRGRVENLQAAEATGRLRFVVGDIRDRPLVDQLMTGVDVVFHQAALRITHCAEAPAEAIEVMVTGTHHVVEAAVAAGVAKLVAASSASVYGQATTFPTDEEHHTYGNRTLYGAAKLFGEGLLRANADRLPYVALRYFNVYGPRMDLHGVHTEVLPRWMDRLDAGEPPKVHGDGSDTLDLVYVDDVARANVLAAQAKVTDRVYNVASGTEVSLLELARRLATAMGRSVEPELTPRPSEVPAGRRLGDPRRAAAELGFRASVDLDDGLARLVDWRAADAAAA